MKGFAANEDPLKLLEEREAIHLLLPQTTSEKIHKNYAAFTINPSTRYPNLSGLVPLGEVASLYDTGTGPIKYVQRMEPVVTKAEKKSAAQEDAINRKRSKDDWMVHGKSEVVHNPRDVLKKPRVVDVLTDEISNKPTDIPSHAQRSPKSKPKVKSEGRSFFHPALKPKPTITSDDVRTHKIGHKKKASKQFAVNNSVTLISHSKITDESVSGSSSSSSKTHRKTVEHKEKTADKSVLPSGSHIIGAAAPPDSGYTPPHSRDRSPPHNEVNVLKMKASFEKRDQDANNSALLRQRISRRSTVSSSETSAARIPRSASFSDLQDAQSNNALSAFPSSSLQPVKHHKSRHPVTSKDRHVEPPKDNPTSVKVHKEPAEPKQSEKSSFLKWLKVPHKQVAAMVASVMHSGSYKPKDETDCGINDMASYNPLPEESSMSTTMLPNMPPSDETSPRKDAGLLSEEVPPGDEDVAEPSADQEAILDVSKDTCPEKQDVSAGPTTFSSQESPSTEDQTIILDEEGTTKGDSDALDDVRVQPLIAKLEPMVREISTSIFIILLYCYRRTTVMM